VLFKAKVEVAAGAERATQATEQGCQQGRAHTLDYLCKVVMMLA